MTIQIRPWLDNAILQSVAESYLDRSDLLGGPYSLDFVLGQGVNHPDHNRAGTGATRLTTTQISWFKANYEIVTHYPNDVDVSGFSATLFKNKTTGEYTLSFRSTEYQLAGKGGDYERDGVNGTDGEISKKGFALAQLSSMEDFYAHLKNGEIKNPATGQWVSDPAAQQFANALTAGSSALDVTGYSLGAHLATAFTLMHGADTQQTYTYNAAGVGAVGLAIPTGQDITGLIDLYRNIMAWDGQGIPSWYLGVSLKSSAAELTALQQAALAEPNGLPAGTVNVYLDAKHQATMAVLAHLMFPAGAGPSVTDLTDGMGDLQINNALENWWASSGAGPLGKDPNAFSSSLYTVGAWGGEIKQFYGHGEFFDPQAVANSGYHAPASAIWIEDLPVSRAWGILEMLPRVGDTQLIRDLVGDFGETHSITPIIDSLTVLDLLQGLDGSIDNARFTQIMKAMSNRVDSLDSVSLQNATAAVLTGIVGFLTSPTLAALGAYISADKLYDADAMENFVNSLTRIFTGTQGTLTPKKMQDGSADPLGYADVTARNDLHVAIEAIRASTTYQLSAGRVQIQALASVGAIDMAARAKTDMGYRYALKELQPFAITGDDALYAQHNATGGLDYYDAVTGTGSLTDVYLKDRADMLVWKIKFDYGKRDINDLLLGVGDKQYDDEWDSNIADNWEFIDRKTQIDGQPLKLTIDGQGAMAYRQIIFGSDLDESDINGGSRSDRLYGGGGADTLTGNAGNDYLEGGAGNDTYIFITGDGYDTILDTDGLGIINLGGVLAKGSASDDLDPAKWIHTAGSDTWIDQANGITYTRSVISGETQLLIHQGDSNILVKGWAEGELGIELGVSTPPPTTHTYTGSNTADFIQNADLAGWVDGGPPNWLVSAAPGWVNRYDGLDGADFIETDLVDDIVDGCAGNDYILSWGGGADTLYGEAGNDLIQIGDPNTTWTVTPTNNRTFVDGGDGNDTITVARAYLPMAIALDGASAGDVYPLGEVAGNFAAIWAAAYTGWQRAPSSTFYVLPDTPDFTFLNWSRDGVSLAQGLDGQLNLYAGFGFSAPEFSAGLPISGVETRFAPAFIYRAFNDNDDITGHTLFGGAGNDMVEGGLGDDFIDGGTDNDALDGERGADIIFGGSGDDLILGGEGNDWLEGGQDNDEMYGEQGNDTYVFAKGAGLDRISDYDTTAGNVDVVQFLDVISDEVTALERNGNDLMIRYGAADQLTVTSYFNTGYKIEQLEFSDGVIWDEAAINARAVTTITGTVGSDTLSGGSGVDMLIGGAGNDALTGGSGADTLVGGAGSDWLTGEDGNDILDGGMDSDRLHNDEGSDTYLFGKGDGFDVISSNIYVGGSGYSHTYSLSGGELNTLQFKDGVSPGEIVIKQSASGPWNLVLNIAGTADDSVVIEGFCMSTSNLNNGYYYSAANLVNPLQQIKFADGTLWDTNELIARLFMATSASDYIGGTDNSDTINGQGGDDRLYGGPGDDILYGGTGSDDLSGGDGNDILDGGAGNDGLTSDAGSDTYLFGKGDGQDIIAAGFGHTLSANEQNTLQFKAGVSPGEIVVVPAGDSLKLKIAGTTDEVSIHGFIGTSNPVQQVKFADGTLWDINELITRMFMGTSASEFINGTDNSDTINGQGGDDNLFGELGDDVLSGGIGNDSLYGGAGNDTLSGGDGDDTLVGDAGNDILRGNNGDDALVGGVGDTEMSGGAGNDIYYVEDTPGAVIEYLNEGVDTVLSSVSHTLATNVENLTLTGTAAINGTGNELANVLTGNSANNTLIGGVGDDILQGGTSGTSASTSIASLVIYARGTPVLDVYPTMQVYVDGVLIQEFMVAAASYTAYTVDPAKLGVSAGKVDVVFTNDAWRPDLGQDCNLFVQKIEVNGQTMNATDNGVYYDPGSGAAAFDGVNLRLGQETLASNGALRFTLSDNDTLEGGAGADQMSGGSGNDTYLVDSANDALTEMPNEGLDTVRSSISHTLGANFENLVLSGTAAINGSGNVLNNLLIGNAGSNILYGDAGVDTLLGYAGNDRLDGGASGDFMYGGQGNDTYVVDSAGDILSENLNEGMDAVESSISYTLGANVESLTLTGTAAINGTGNNLDNTLKGNSANNLLTGGAGNDVLYGDAGADTLIGGVGDDRYYVEDASDIVTENANEGVDTVYVFGSVAYTLAANVENGYSPFWAGSLTGNALNNTLSGSYGSDTLDGGLGADTLKGWGGNDTYIVDNAGDVVSETSTVATEIDTVQSSVSYTLGANVENLSLTGTESLEGTGNALANVLQGNGSSSILYGLDGNDTLYASDGDEAYGGGGNDTLVAENTLTWAYLSGEDDDDTLTGGAGSGSYSGGQGNDTITGGAGYNYLWGDDAYGATTGGNDLILGGASIDNVWGGYGNDTLHGNDGDDTLLGQQGDDQIYGGAGNDTLVGGTGNDTYRLGRGYAADTVVENDATVGNTDIAQFLTGVAADQIWFQKVGNNLETSVIGTSDKLVVKDWYLGTAYHVEQFKTIDGAKTLLDSNVQNLVNAMASFAPPAAGQTTLPTNYQTSLAPVIAANWQ